MVIGGRLARRRARAAAASLACAVLISGAAARADESRDELAARLEHKLAYLSADYAMAATSTGGSDEGESDEHARLATELEAMPGKLGLSPRASQSVTRVSSLVRQNAAAADVTAAVEQARAVLIAELRIPVAPSATPDAARGRALFEQYCATCHGMTGRGDTERAASLKPRPANYLDPSIGEPLSPYRITTTVRFGVEGTAMVPFGFLGEAERWDVAFYAMGLRHIAPVASEGPLYDLSELALLSDEQLRSGLRAGGVPETSVEPVLTELRRRAPYERPAGGYALVAARRALREAVADVYRGEGDLAVAGVQRGERDFRATETALRRLDPDLAQALRIGFRALLTRIEGGTSAKDIGLAVTSQLDDVLRAERETWRSYGALGSVAGAAETAFVVTLGVGSTVVLIAILLSIAAEAGAARRNAVYGGGALALVLGVSISQVCGRGAEVPLAALDGTRCGLSLLVAGGIVYIGLVMFARRPASTSHETRGAGAAAFFLVPFAASLRDASSGRCLLQSMAACGMPVRPMTAGLLLAMAGLMLMGSAYVLFAARSPPGARRPITIGLGLALTTVFTAQAGVALWSMVTRS